MPNKNCPFCFNSTENCLPNVVIKCDGCNVKMHRACLNLPNEEDITRPKNKNVKYFCNECSNVEDKFDQLKNFIVQLVDQKFASLELTINNRERSEIPAVVQENIIAEATERLLRRSNLIIRNLPESNDSDSDTRVVMKVLSEIQGTNVSAPLSINRIGRYSATKPRLIKVRMNDPSQVTLILRNKKKLTLHEQYKKIIISSDQTPQQIKYLGELRTLLKQRQDAGEPNITIKYKNGIPNIVSTDEHNTTASQSKN